MALSPPAKRIPWCAGQSLGEHQFEPFQLFELKKKKKNIKIDSEGCLPGMKLKTVHRLRELQRGL